MTTAPTARAAVALAVLLLLGACARQDAGSPPERPGLPGAPDELVLQVSHTGGFTTPELLAARLPLVSVHADGRVLTPAPVIAIHPGPAWPDLQVQRIDRAAVHELVDRARAAGVTATDPLGTPPLADAPTTRFTLATATDTTVREVYALAEAAGLDPADDGLTAGQRAARAELQGLLDALTDLPTALGSDAVPPTALHEPTAVAVLARPWTDDSGGEPGLVPPDVRWPGPALPGGPVGPLPDLGCVTATGEQARALVAAARSATALTPWVTDDGARWAVTFRPLLPSESGCADLAAGR